MIILVLAGVGTFVVVCLLGLGFSVLMKMLKDDEG